MGQTPKNPKGGPLDEKIFFSPKSSLILVRVGSNDQKFCADSKNIYINGVAMVLTVVVAVAVLMVAASLPMPPTLLICIFLESAYNF